MLLPRCRFGKLRIVLLASPEGFSSWTCFLATRHMYWRVLWVGAIFGGSLLNFSYQDVPVWYVVRSRELINIKRQMRAMNLMCRYIAGRSVARFGSRASKQFSWWTFGCVTWCFNTLCVCHGMLLCRRERKFRLCLCLYLYLYLCLCLCLYLFMCLRLYLYLQLHLFLCLLLCLRL